MNGSLALAALVLLGVLAYAADLWRRPYTRCHRCKGTGRVAGSTSKRWGPCPKCTDRPPRKRLGAQLVRPALRRRK